MSSCNGACSSCKHWDTPRDYVGECMNIDSDRYRGLTYRKDWCEGHESKFDEEATDA